MDYEEGTLLWYWYANWIVVAGFAMALVLAVLVVAKSGWGTGELFLKIAMVVAVLAVLPLTLVRVGMNPTFEDDTTVGYLSLAGVVGSLVVGLSYLIATRARPVSEAEVSGVEGIVTPEQGVPLPPEPEGGTMTLQSAPAPAASEGDATVVGGMPQAPGEMPTQAPPAWLLFKSGPRAGQSIPLSSEATSIGRGSDNDVVVDDPAASRQHAQIAFQDGTFVMEDAGSSGGTLVEGATAARQVLASGSTVQIGETEMVFMQGEAPSGPAATGAGGPAAGAPGETMVMEQKATVMAWLAVTAGHDKGKTFQLKASETTIGRDQGNDVAISDAAASRRHATIMHQEGTFLILDMGSSGGTKVNGEAISGKVLSTGGVITVGQTQMVVVDVEAQEAADMPADSGGATMVAQPAVAGGGGILVVRSGPDAGKSFSLTQEDNTIGRDPTCQILLTDQAISRLHAMIRRHGDGYMVYDLGSRSGTDVDGDSVTGSSLSPGDVISVGRTEMTLMQPEQAK